MGHIIVLEPDVRLARTYGGLFATRSHTVEACTTAQDAIIAADEQKPDVVVLELQLVAHSGVEFLYEFRSYADWQAVPVIILSNVPPDEFAKSRSLLRRLGVAAYYYKPRTSLQTLLHGVEDALSHARGEV
jgi:DNA-binding response OmpR family regulator